MTRPRPRGLSFEVVRITIETASPLTIGSGLDDDLRDRPCVVTADGLPTIPGSSIAGALRRALAGDRDPQSDGPACRAFGTLEKRDLDSRPSYVEVSWAQVHDSFDRPAPMRGANLDDPVLSVLLAPIVRDHVRIDGHGAAAHRGKFDESLVPVGARFTFEIVVHEGSGVEGADLVALLSSGVLRLGGSTRRGHGEISVIRVCARRFDLVGEARAEDRKAFALLPRALDQQVTEGVLPLIEPPDPGEVAGVLDAKILLDAESTWMFGGGHAVLSAHRRNGMVADGVPWTEGRIRWNETTRRGEWSEDEPDYAVVASGVKGALRHRTAFHARRLAGDYWKPGFRKEKLEEVRPEVEALFGEMKGLDGGTPGRIFLSDFRLPAEHASTWLDHVSLDRFTGAPLDGHLFSEAPLLRGRIELRIAIDTRGFLRSPGKESGENESAGEAVDMESHERARRALGLALRDLATGHLGVGAGTTKGHGTFRAAEPAHELWPFKPGDRNSGAAALKEWLFLGEVE